MAMLVALSWVACNRTLDFSSPTDGGGTGGAPITATGGMTVIGNGGDAGSVVVTSGGATGSGGMVVSTGGMGTGGSTGGARTGGARTGGAGGAGGTVASGGRATGGMMATGGASSGGFTGACTSDANCGLAGLHCDTTGTHTCVECLPAMETVHCAGSFPRCDPATHRCVQCLSSGAGCATGQICIQNLCITTCPANTTVGCPGGTTDCEDPASANGNRICMACGGDSTGPCPSGLACVTAAGQCRQCATTTDCNLGQFCDPARFRCGQCIAHSDCPAAFPICDFAAPTGATCRAAP